MEEKKENHQQLLSSSHTARTSRSLKKRIVGGFLQQTLYVPLTMSLTTPKLVTIGVG